MIPLLAITAALATDRGPGTWMIGANVADAGEGWVSAGATSIGRPTRTQTRDGEAISGWLLLPAVETFYGVTDRFGVQARAQAGPVFAADRTYVLATPVIGARWLVVDRPGLAVAPTVTALGVFGVDDTLAGAAFGLALNWRGDRLGLDASVPVAGALIMGREVVGVWPWAGALVSEVGVTLALGDDALRIGSTGAFFPMATWRHRWGDAFVDVSGGWGVEFGPTAGFQAGRVLGGG